MKKFTKQQPLGLKHEANTEVPKVVGPQMPTGGCFRLI